MDSAYRIGANSYLVKPPNAEKLLNLVKCLSEYWFEWNFRSPPYLRHHLRGHKRGTMTMAITKITIVICPTK